MAEPALKPLFSDIANAIREKDGSTGTIPADTFPERIRGISSEKIGLPYPLRTVFVNYKKVLKNSRCTILYPGELGNSNNKILTTGMNEFNISPGMFHLRLSNYGPTFLDASFTYSISTSSQYDCYYFFDIVNAEYRDATNYVYFYDIFLYISWENSENPVTITIEEN